jgi:hypothetical protein
MAELINLRRARKRKARAAREVEAEAQRARHGAPRAFRKLEQASQEKALREHESRRLDDKQK